MVDQKEVDFMAKLQAKLNGNAVARAPGQGAAGGHSKSSNPDIAAMENILGKLNEATDKVVAQTESPTPNNIMARTSRTSTGLEMMNYKINISEEQWGKRTKKWYTIVDTQTGETLHEDLTLFESAVGIVYALLNSRPSQADTIATLDQRYRSKLSECAHYKQLAARATEDFKLDLYETKFEDNKARAKAVRNEIRKKVWF